MAALHPLGMVVFMTYFKISLICMQKLEERRQETDAPSQTYWKMVLNTAASFPAHPPPKHHK